MKKPLIINVRGNSGSGKTTLTRQFMEPDKTRERFVDWISGKPMYASGVLSNKVQFYEVIYQKQRWAVLGSYENTCGGCDTIQTQAEIIRLIEFVLSEGYNVWLEGLLISGMYGSLGEYSEQFEDRWVFAFLDTPLKTCLKHVQQRRKAAGNKKPFNPSNTINRHATIVRTRERLLEKKRRVVDLPWQDALAPLLKIIRKEG